MLDVDRLIKKVNKRCRVCGFDRRVEAVQNILIELKNPEYIYEFACKTEGCDVERLQNAIIESKNPIYMF